MIFMGLSNRNGFTDFRDRQDKTFLVIRKFYIFEPKFN